MTQKNLSAKKLKDALWETLESMKKGEASISDVTASASITREIIRCTNTQLKIASYTGRDLPKDVEDFLEAEGE